MPTPDSVVFDLTRHTLGEIGGSMLHERPWLPSALVTINDQYSSAELGEVLASESAVRSIEEDEVDTSLTAQLRDVFANPKRPDYFALTMQSAIPLADCIRGVYRVLGEKEPRLVAVDTKAGVLYERSRTTTCVAAQRNSENSTLAGLTGCLIDQYLAEGETIVSASQLLLSAGSKYIHVMRARWYHNAHRVNPDIHTMSSDVDLKMQQIGERAALACLGTTNTSTANARHATWMAYLHPLGLQHTSIT